MTLDQLKYFAAAAKYSHVGKAAVSVHISPSAISNAVGALEEELGCLLFKRDGKHIFITDKGVLLRDRAQVILDSISAVQLEVSGNLAAIQGHFHLGASHFLSTRFLGKAWGRLKKNHSKLSADLSSTSTYQVLAEIIGGSLDAGLCFSPLQHPDFLTKDLYQGNLKLCFRAKHPLAAKKPFEILKELSNFPAIIHKAKEGVDICEYHPMFEKFHIQPKVDLFFDNDDYAIQQIVSSDSWSLLPDLVIQSDKRLTSFTPEKWVAPYTVSFVVRRQRDSNPALNLLLNEIQLLLNLETPTKRKAIK